MLSVGDRVDGYRVERLLGEGGMGAVYAVTDQAGRTLAMKVLLDTTDATLTKRFMREASMTARLTSPNTTKVYGTGSLPSGTPYLLMELLDGVDLADLLHEQGALSCEQAVSCVVDVCQALAEAHALGMVHRDIKPANMFLHTLADGTRCVKLVDFGISKPALNPVAPMTQLTQSGTVLGSPDYMAPEQIMSSSDVDARADIWALGATLHELLTNETAFTGDTLAEVISAIMRDPPRALSVARPDVPAALVEVVARCLDKDPDQRFANVGELVAALQAALPTRHAQTLPYATPRAVLGDLGTPSSHAAAVSQAAVSQGAVSHAVVSHRIGAQPTRLAPTAETARPDVAQAPTLAHGTPAAPSSPQSVPSSAPTHVGTPSGAPVGPGVTTIAPEKPPRRVWPAALLVLVSLAIGAVATLVWTQQSSSANTSDNKASKKKKKKNGRKPSPLSEADRKIDKATRKRIESSLAAGRTLLEAGKVGGAEAAAQRVLDALRVEGINGYTQSNYGARAKLLMAKVTIARWSEAADAIDKNAYVNSSTKSFQLAGATFGFATEAELWQRGHKRCPLGPAADASLRIQRKQWTRIQTWSPKLQRDAVSSLRAHVEASRSMLKYHLDRVQAPECSKRLNARFTALGKLEAALAKRSEELQQNPRAHPSY